MKVRYIAIEREYGSGGTEIAEKTAQRCAIAWYGREILERTAKEQQTSVEALEAYEEDVSGSLLYSMFVMTQSQTGNPDLLSQQAKLFVAESQVIRELAKTGPAIFVGHCACKALEEEAGVLRVFIRGSEADKQRRAKEEYHIPEKHVEAVCRKFNKKRGSYYSFCTRKKWNDPQNYDMILDSSALGVDGCAAALAAVYQELSAK